MYRQAWRIQGIGGAEGLHGRNTNSSLEVKVGGKYRVAVSGGFDCQLLGEVLKARENLA